MIHTRETLRATSALGTDNLTLPPTAGGSMASRLTLDPRRYRRTGPGRLPDRTMAAIPALSAACLAAILTSAGQLWSWVVIPVALLAPTLAWIDLDSHRLPNAYVATLGALNLLGLIVVTITTADGSLLARGLIAAGATTALLIVAIMAGSGMGMGDVKLLAALTPVTAAIGWPTYLAYLSAAFMLSGIIAVGLLLLRKARMSTRLPLGPVLLASFIVVICVST